MLFAQQKNLAVIHLHHRELKSAEMSEYIYEFIQHNKYVVYNKTILSFHSICNTFDKHMYF